MERNVMYTRILYSSVGDCENTNSYRALGKLYIPTIYTHNAQQGKTWDRFIIGQLLLFVSCPNKVIQILYFVDFRQNNIQEIFIYFAFQVSRTSTLLN